MPDNAKAKKPRKPRGKNGTPLAKYPPVVLQDLDRLILAGYGAVRCCNFLVANYSDVLAAPSHDTMQRHINARKEVLETDLDLKLKIEALSREVDMTKLDPKDMLSWVEGLLRLNAQLMQNNLLRNRNAHDPRVEKIVADVSHNTASLLETKMRLEAHGKLMTTRLQSTVRILSHHLIEGIVQTYKDIHGEKKLKEFGDGLDAMVKGLDLEAIEDELNEALGVKGTGRG